MASELHCVKPNRVITGWDFSTGAVKCLAFDLDGRVLAEVRLPTDLWHEGDEEGISELNLMQLEGQARASVRAIAARLRDLGRLKDWAAGGISATHHTAGRIDRDIAQVRRAICWNDHSLARYHAIGLDRLGGQDRVRELIGGPWAIRYSLSHLVKDEVKLSEADWHRTYRILPHGPLSAGFLTGNYDVTSVSAAASTGIMDLRRHRWCKEMLDAIEWPEYRTLAWKQLPRIVHHHTPVGLLAEHVALEPGIDSRHRPLIFPTSDDQQAGLVGGGAVDSGQMAVILGNSAVVNSSSKDLPARGNLDVMALNWGPYLYMRCYNNGAQFLDQVVGPHPDWQALGDAARACPPGCDGTAVMPFVAPEPSLGVDAAKAGLRWFSPTPLPLREGGGGGSGAGARREVPPSPYPLPERERGQGTPLPSREGQGRVEPGRAFRASLEAIAYLIRRGVEEHEQAGQKIARITVSGGIARSDLMCEILATVLERRVERLESDEGPALGAAVTALAALETHLRKQRNIKGRCSVADAVAQMVRLKAPVDPNPQWIEAYRAGWRTFNERLAQL